MIKPETPSEALRWAAWELVTKMNGIRQASQGKLNTRRGPLIRRIKILRGEYERLIGLAERLDQLVHACTICGKSMPIDHACMWRAGGPLHVECAILNPLKSVVASLTHDRPCTRPECNTDDMPEIDL